MRYGAGLCLQGQPRFNSFPDTRAQIFFQTGEGGFKGVVVLPVGEIGEVILADRFWRIRLPLIFFTEEIKTNRGEKKSADYINNMMLVCQQR